MDSKLTIKVLGNAALIKDGQTIEKFRSRKAIALIAYLACTQSDHKREHLADLLWDSSSTKQSLSNLRTVLAMIRSKLNGYLHCDQALLGIKSQPEVDYLTLRQEIGSAKGRLDEQSANQLIETLGLYQGEFMEGFDVQNAPRFLLWAETERRQLRNQVLGAYQKVAAFQLSTGDFITGIDTTSRWLQLDPIDEAAHSMLIEMLAKSGRRGAAIAQYKICEEVLQRELDVEPTPAIQQLYRQIRGVGC